MAPNVQCTESSPKFVGCAVQPFPEVPDGDDLLSESKPTTVTTTQNWTCVSSKKSMRTINPIRAIVDPIMANGIQSGLARGDGKDHISLAVSGKQCQFMLSCDAYTNTSTSFVLRIVGRSYSGLESPGMQSCH